MNKKIGLLCMFWILAACQKKTEVNLVRWETGDDPAILNQLNSIEKSKESVTAYYKNKSIRFAIQNLDGVPVANTFIKSVANESTSPQRVLAGYYSKMKVELVPRFKRKSDINHLKLELEALLPKAIRSVTTDFEYTEVNGVLRSRLLIDAELIDGNMWRGSYDENGHLTDLKSLGSRFTNVLDAKLTVYDRGPKFSTLVEVLVKNLLVSPTISNSQVLVTSESSQKIINVNANMKFDTKDERFDQLQTFFYISKVTDWMKENLNVSLPTQLTAVVNVGYPEPTNTAFYFQNKIRFGRGDDITYTALTSDPSIVYHEAFHAMIDGIAHLPFEKEGGSLNEAFADFFTCVALDRPFLGESSYLKGPFKRSLAVDYKRTDKTGGLYHDSQIFSALLWDLKIEFGKTIALKLAMETLLRLHPMSDFSDFDRSIVTVGKQNLNSEQLVVFFDLLKKRGFPHE